MTAPQVFDVVVVGGGPGGSTTASFLANGGLRVALFEREVFPRFHVGESLMPAAMWVLERMGARAAVEQAGFQIKYGAMFIDAEVSEETTFFFQIGQAWPSYTYQVPRAEFDTLLLNHARGRGVAVFQPATVETAAFDAAGVTVTATAAGRAISVRAGLLVDASGRDGFLAARLGQRQRIPNLGKVALFAHFRGADRLPGKAEGNIRIYVFPEGWFWWIPLAGDLTSVGAVMHARTVRDWAGTPDDLYAKMIGRCGGVAAGLARAERVTDIHRLANFSYLNSPVVGDRFLAVGDAVMFVDPIFSGGVYIAMRSGQLAAEAILAAFRDGRFEARRFAAYERRIRRGVAPLLRFIHKYYEPAFFYLLMRPHNYFGVYTAVLNVLSGGSFIKLRWRTRLSLAILFGLARGHRWLRRWSGLPYASRLEW
ncbi:MAG: NAD(P)/FAD-dependent oxidoreductase [Candidatus Rokuibacteriota bacterium]